MQIMESSKGKRDDSKQWHRLGEREKDLETQGRVEMR